MTQNTNTQTQTWHQETLEKILLENLKEQRRKRRWGIFFKLIYFLIFLVIVGLLLPETDGSTGNRYKPHVALITISGELLDGSDNDAKNTIESLESAMNNKNAHAIILNINSPGGSPVQASDIYNAIRYQEKLHPDKKVIAVCSDLCASAAYYVASASNDIYANPASIVGSIGVLLNGFGFVDALNKVGVQRRLLTAGSEKGFLDPFSPLTDQDKQYANAMLETVHQQFINDVKQGRGNRLDVNNPLIFSGLAWTGQQAKPLGLIDGFGSYETVARDILKNTNIVDYTQTGSLLSQFSQGLGTSFSKQIGAVLNMHLA